MYANRLAGQVTRRRLATIAVAAALFLVTPTPTASAFSFLPPSNPNLVLKSWSCEIPTEFAYLPDGDPVQVDCTVHVDVDGWFALYWFPGAQMTISLVALAPSAGFFQPGTPVDSRVIQSRRHPAGFFPNDHVFQVSMSLSEADNQGAPMSDWIADHYQQGHRFGYRIDYDPANEIAEPGEITPDNSAVSSFWQEFRIVPLTGALRYGAATAQITSGHLIAAPLFGQSGNCPFGQFALSADATASWTSSTWSTVALDVAGKCVRQVSASPSGIVVSAQHWQPPVEITGTMGGLPSTAVVGLGPLGVSVSAATLTLPAGHTWHGIRGDGRPVSRGVREISFPVVTMPGFAGFGASMSQLRARIDNGFVQAPGMPFALRVDYLQASSAKVKGRHSGTHYHYDRPHAAGDRRAPAAAGLPPRVASNDIRLSRSALSQPTSVFTLRPAGLSTRVGFESVDGMTHFPVGALASSAFEMAISSGRIRSGQSVGTDSHFEFVQTTACGACANPGEADLKHHLSMVTPSAVTRDGAVSARTSGWEAPRWGAYTAADGYVFERDESGEQTGLSYWPGFWAPHSGGAAYVSVADSLLGSRELQAKGALLVPAAHHLRTDRASRHGNYAFAGLNVGPYEYRNDYGQPEVGLGTDLTGTTTSARLGGHGQPNPCPGGPCEFEANLGTKYVLRPDGLTGVFNTDDISAFTDLQVYGFELPLHRFGFRLRSNQVDEITWMDGAVRVPEPGGFELDFESLSFDCTGTLHGGSLEGCPPGSPPTGPNCGETLDGWNTAFAPLSMSFVADNADAVCGGSNRSLRVGHSLDIDALELPLALAATWSAGGQPSDATITGRTEHVLDRPESPQDALDDRGLDVIFDGPVSLHYNAAAGGSFIASATLGAPFWNAFEADIRLAQQSPVQAAPTVVVRAGSLATLADVDPLDPQLEQLMRHPDHALTARYEWGSTGFSLDYQVGYGGNTSDEGIPKFRGLEKSTSLVVIEVSGSVDYVTPTSTAVSFGASASADVSAFTDIDLHIDLRDPRSLARIDDWLNLLGVSGTPVTDAVGSLTLRLDAVLEGFASFHIEAAFEAAIGATLDVAVAGIPGIPFQYDNVFDYVASLFAEIESVPARLAVEASVALQEVTAEITAGLTAELHATVLQIYNEFAVTLESGACGVQCDEIRDDIARVRAVLADMIAALDLAEAVANRIPAALNVVVNAALDAIQVADGVLTAIAAVTFFDAGFVIQFESANISSNVLLAAALALAAPVLEPLIEELEVFEIIDDLAELADHIPLESMGLGRVAADIRNQALGLASDVAELADAFSIHVEGGSYEGTLGAAGTWFLQLQGRLQTAEIQLGSVQASFEPPLDRLRELMAIARTVIEGADATLAFLDGELICLSTPGCLLTIQATAAVGIRAEIDAHMLAMTSGAFSFGSNGAFTVALDLIAKTPFDLAIADLLASVRVSLPTLDSFGALTDGFAIRATLVDFVMNAEAVADLMVSIEQHFVFVVEAAVDLGQLGLDQLDALLRELVASAEAALASALEGASAVVEGIAADLPFTAGRIDGSTLITANSLERLHLGADFSRAGATEEAESAFNASLDVKAWSTDAEGVACAGGDASALLDATISTSNVKMSLGGSETTLDHAELGFTLDQQSFPPAVVGVFGGLSTSGGFDFDAFRFHDLGLEMGLGVYETYLGAKGTATFGETSLSAAFLMGRTCGPEVLEALDPQVAEFITLPNNIFNGVFARGSATIPVADYGCLLRLSVLADMGAWILAGPPVTFGGLVGGGASGKFACIGSLRGQVTLFGEKSGSNIKFRGDGFAVAGAGFDCDRGTWTSISRSRRDKWCGTGDASVRGTYENGDFHISKPSVSAIH